MRASVLVLLVLACRGAAPVPTHTGGAVADMRSVPPRPVATVKTLSATSATIAPHGGRIMTVAITPDGSAALSADERGGIRLWPALDGKHEPVVVDLPRPRQLALLPRAGGYTAFALDDVGGLVIVQLDADGTPHSRTTVPAEPAIQQVATTEFGLLALRSDQMIDLYDADATVIASIAAPPGGHVVSVTAAGTRAAAVVDDDAGRGVRWLRLQPKLAWGDATAAQDLDRDIAVAPGQQRFAGLVRSAAAAAHRLVVIDANGKRVVDFDRVEVGALGFLDDDHVVLANGTTTMIVDVNKPEPGAKPLIRVPAALAMAPGRALVARLADLMLVTTSSTQYLGYGFVAPRFAREGAGGALVLSNGQRLFTVDAQLAATESPKLAMIDPRLLFDMRCLGGDDWFLATAGRQGVSLQLADTQRGVTTALSQTIDSVPTIRFEPSTGLLTLTSARGAQVLKFDAAKHDVMVLATASLVNLTPVAPARAGGDQLVQIRANAGGIDWIPDPRALDKPRHTITRAESFGAVDAAGRVYTWEVASTQKWTLHIVDGNDGEHGGEHGVALDEHGLVVPDPRGDRFAVVSRRLVAMYNLDGTQLWARSFEVVQDALWLQDGALALVGSGGIARVDPATGNVLAARCGWELELSSLPHAVVVPVEPLCVEVGK